MECTCVADVRHAGPVSRMHHADPRMAGAEADADYAEVKDRPCHVSKFDFFGINRTKLAIVERELLPVWQAK